MKENILFVTGTDTGIGKTFVTSALVSALVAQGIRVSVCKPLESGEGDGPSDAELLWRAQGRTQKREDVCLYHFKNPVTPAVASAIEGIAVSGERVMKHLERLAAECDLLIVEGVGGLLSPLLAEYTLADLGEKLSATFLLVVGSRLGAINHTSLTLEVLRARGLSVLGYVFNDLFNKAENGRDVALATNRAILAEVAGRYEVPELCYVPQCKTGEVADISNLVSAVVLRFPS